MHSSKSITAIVRLTAASGFAAIGLGMFPTAQAYAAGEHAAVVEIPPGKVEFYSTAQRQIGGRPAPPARVTVEFSRPVQIMKRQVSQAEYVECVRAKACRELDKTVRGDVSPDRPVVGVSWQDATDYARWYSQHTGDRYRLPTYAEWAYAAGEAFKEDLRLDIYDTDNPAQRWLAEYAVETQRKLAQDTSPKLFGFFGQNAAGVQDLGGNVWDWTDTCLERQYLGEDGKALLPANQNCGVRVVAGSHFSLITDFMRDPKAGACSVGIPPANLGIRLVREV